MVSGMEKLTRPDPLDLDSSNISDAWKKWKQCFELLTGKWPQLERQRNPSRDTTTCGQNGRSRSQQCVLMGRYWRQKQSNENSGEV